MVLNDEASSLEGIINEIKRTLADDCQTSETKQTIIVAKLRLLLLISSNQLFKYGQHL